MKKLLFVLLISVPYAVAMNHVTKLPKKEVIQERLERTGMNYLADKTHMLSRLYKLEEDEQELSPIAIVSLVEECIIEYNQEPISFLSPEKIHEQITRSHILEALLFPNRPNALVLLKRAGRYETIPELLSKRKVEKSQS